MRQKFVLAKCLAGVWLLPALVGCGDAIDASYKPVTGTVLLDGTPLADAIVSFMPEQGSSASGRTDENGVYTLYYAARRPGARVGDNRVVITKEVTLAAGRNEFAVITEDECEMLPPRYNTQTELTATVSDSTENVIDFELTLK